jgi:DNA-binding transcriptional ArsR family regulator
VVNEIDVTFAALADPTRRRVVELLRESPLRASEMAARVGVSRPAMSNHLKALRSSGLVDVALSEEDGRARSYRLRPERLVALQGWLSELEVHWARQLESFREHSERGGERRS